MAGKSGSQIIHRGGEIKTMPRTLGGPVPLVGADGIPALLEDDVVPPLAGEDEGFSVTGGSVEFIPVDELMGPVSEPLNSEPLYA